MPEALLVDHPADGVALVTLNRPDKHNAVTLAMQADLDALLCEFEADGTRCLVLTGAGDRAFSAGYDLHEMAEWDHDEMLVRLVERERWVAHFAQTDLPVVAALNGVAYGIGAILATAADVRCASPDARIRFTAGAHGGANATWSLPGLIGRAAAAEILLTAREVGAAEALALGLVTRVADDVVEAACGIAEAIAANPPAGARAIKRLLREHARTVPALEAENLLMRTDLRPRPVVELYERRF